MSEESLDTIMDVVTKNPGKRPLILEFVLPNGRSVAVSAGERFHVADERSLVDALERYTVDA